MILEEPLKTRVSPLVALAIISAAMLTGCSFNFTPIIDADDLAETAQDALEDEYDGQNFDVDCGDDDIKLIEDEDYDCLVTDESDLEYDAEVTITSVTGSKYKIDVDVADEANNADDVDPGDSNDVTVPGPDIAALAAKALADVIDYTATDMQCESDNVAIFVDNTEYCYFTGPDGTAYTVEVTVTEFDATTLDYKINAEIIS